MRKIVMICCSIALGLITAFLVVELAVRVLGLAQQTTSMYQTDPLIGINHIPASGSWWRKKEFQTFVTFNAEGFRDEDHSVQKPAGVYRIAVLGDSYVEALQLPAEKTFPKLLEQRLNNQVDGKKYEVFNFGISGFGIAQDYLALKHYAYKYDPDLVILAVTTGNDVRNGHPDLELESAKPYFMKKENGVDIRPFKVQKRGFVSDIMNRYLFLQSYVYFSQTVGPFIWQMRTKKKMAGSAPLPLDYYVYSDPYSSVWQEAWDLTTGGIALMKKELSVKGKALLVVALTDNDAQIDGTLQGNLERMNADPALKWDGEKPVKILGEFCSREQIAFLPLLYEFRDQHRKSPEKFHFIYDGHWNSRGHEIAADGIYKKLVSGRMIGHAESKAQ